MDEAPAKFTMPLNRIAGGAQGRAACTRLSKSGVKVMLQRKNHWARVLVPATVVAIGAAGAAGAARAADAVRSFEIYGFAEADAIADSKRVDPNWTDAFRPSKIGVDGQYGTNGWTSLSVKQSRFGVKGTQPTGDNSAPIDFKFEFDMFGVGADAGKTAVRLRHAYGEWGQLLAGQTNSLFMDGDVYPNVFDYWGPTGMVFYRNVQIRWTAFRTATDHFAVAVERPGNDVDPGNIREIDQYSNAIVRADQKWPDLTLQYRHNDSWGHVQASGILRSVGYEVAANGDPNGPWSKGSQTGWGINLGAGIKTIDKDQVLLQVVYGEGIASYMNDGGMDLAPSAALSTCTPVGGVACAPSLRAKAVPLTGIVAYYDHYWNSMWSSSIGYSVTQVDNTNFQTATAYHKGDYASVNLFAYPASNLALGGELLWGKRTNNDGSSGDDVRFQFSIKYSFGTKL
jgi:DcaP outer membrane protein